MPMKRIFQIICIMLAVLIFIPSCDGNVFVKPDVSKDMEETRLELENHLAKKKVDIYGPKTSLYEVIEKYLLQLNSTQEEDKQISKGEIEKLARYLIPEGKDINLYIVVENIPFIDETTMGKLLFVEKPQDIEYVNGMLSKRITGNAEVAVGQLYKAILLPFFGPDKTDCTEGIFAFKNIIHLTDDHRELTNGDYVAVQLLITLLLNTIPESIYKNYIAFLDKKPGSTIEDYIEDLGYNMIEALIINKAPIIHILSTYTFLNKYNASTTILDMKNLGTFFTVDEEVE